LADIQLRPGEIESQAAESASRIPPDIRRLVQGINQHVVRERKKTDDRE
jgi:hypothetical protein